MHTAFHKDLDELKHELLTMGDLALSQFEKATMAMSEEDIEMANEVLDDKQKVSDLDDLIEDEALRLLVLYQPVAKDMRELACILKTITYLERIGRYGKDIANIAKNIEEEADIPGVVSTMVMADIVTSMVKDCLEAFSTENLIPIENLIEREERVDRLRYTVVRECITYMMENPKYIVPCMNHIMAARYIERCGDHACKIAEKVHYMVTGERIEIR